MHQARLLVSTWPRRFVAFAATALAASAIAYFSPGLWQQTAEKTGLASAPIEVEVVSDPELIQGGGVKHHIANFVIPRPINEIGAPPAGNTASGRYPWAHELGGVDAGESLVRLVVNGTSPSAVVLLGLRVEILDRQPPTEGSHVTVSGGGAAQSVRYFHIDLDQPAPVPEYVGSSGEDQEAPFPYRVSQGELEVIDVTAFTGASDVRWQLVLEYSAEGKQDRIVVDDNGDPFQTTAAADQVNWSGAGEPPQTAYWWNGEEWEQYAALR